MPRDDAPHELRVLADARARARRTRDWRTADDLKAQIEAAGWKVIDTGTLYDLRRAAPLDIEVDGTVRYGASRGVPSRLEDLPVGVATVVIVLDDPADDPAAAVASLAEHAPDGTTVVLVADGVADALDDRLAALDAADPGAPGVVVEVVRTVARLGAAAARNAGIRRSGAPVVVLLDPDVRVEGDLVSALVAALDDESVAVAGAFGQVAHDVRSFQPAPADAVDVDAVDLAAMAFRRTDAVERGPLDEHFTIEDGLAAWWSLVLRDVPDDAPEDATPRRAVQVRGLAARRADADGDTAGTDPARERLARRNTYRVLKRFATRDDLLGAGR